MSNEEVYHQSPKIDESSTPAVVEKGWFDFMKKKEEPEKCEETAISTEFEEKVNVSEPEPVLEEKHETLVEKFHQSHDGSSSGPPKIDESSNPAAVEKGWFDFMKKKEEPEKCEETAISTEFEEKVNVSEPEPVLEEKQAVSTEFEEKVNVSEPEPVLEEKQAVSTEFEEKVNVSEPEPVLEEKQAVSTEFEEKVNVSEPEPVLEEKQAVSTEFEEKVNVSEPEPVLEEKQAVSAEFEEKVNVSEPEPVLEEKNETLLEKFHQSHDGSSSGSSSDEEVGEDGEKKKKKKQKPLKQVIEDKFEDYKENKEEEKIEKQEEDTYVPVEKCEEVAVPPPHSEVAVPPPHSEVVHPTPTPEPEGKRGFMGKIKDKLHGGHKKTEEEHVAPSPPAPVAAPCEPMPAAPSYDGLPMPAAPSYDGLEEPKEKKGILEKIKEKIPGYHSKSEEEK